MDAWWNGLSEGWKMFAVGCFGYWCLRPNNDTVLSSILAELRQINSKLRYK